MCCVTNGEMNDLKGAGKVGLASSTSMSGLKNDLGLGVMLEEILLPLTGVVVAYEPYDLDGVFPAAGEVGKAVETGGCCRPTRALVAGDMDSGSEVERGRRGVDGSGPGKDEREILLPPAAARRSFPGGGRPRRETCQKRRWDEGSRERRKVRRGKQGEKEEEEDDEHLKTLFAADFSSSAAPTG